MRRNGGRSARGGVVLLGAILAGALWPASARAGVTLQIDDTKWLSIGAGLRASYTGQEDGAGVKNDRWSNNFNLDNARVYLNGQVYKYIKFEFNTECLFCGSPHERYDVLDAIAKFELRPDFNIWGGRLLVPSERAEMDGPFYANVYEGFKTPLYPADFSTKFGSGGAGVYARDHGVNIWGNTGPGGKLKYVFGVFNGLRGASNADDHPLFATRIAYQFLGIEDNPGYYTSSTYYGKAGPILTLAYALQYQEDGAGSAQYKSDFMGMSVDGLFEKPIADAGVFTAEAEYKHFDADYNVKAFQQPAGTETFNMFRGNAYTVTALYLLPFQVGIGAFQPYTRFSQIDPRDSSDRNEFEAGLNYIISGHNARVSLFYQYGDLATKGIVNFAPEVHGARVSVIGLGVQLQI